MKRMVEGGKRLVDQESNVMEGKARTLTSYCHMSKNARKMMKKDLLLEEVRLCRIETTRKEGRVAMMRKERCSRSEKEIYGTQ